MRRIILIASALVAGLLLAAIPVAASAAPETPEELPSIAAERSSTGANIGTPEFHGVLTVACKEATNLSTRLPGTVPLGLFHIHIKGCTALGGTVKCTGLDELETGVILVLGTWHLWWDRKDGGSFTGLTTATIFLLEPVHFSCGAATLVMVRGVQVCLDLNPTTSSTTHEGHCEASETKQTEEYCEKEKESTCSSGWVVPKLESSTNGGAFKESALLALATVIEPAEVFADI